jgi:hypothetical protein
MSDRHRRFRFLPKYAELLAALPVAAVAEWLQRVGVEGARFLARHLPPPSVSEAGQTYVPEITEYVLRAFEDDQRTFEEFCCGVGSGLYWTEGGQKRQRDADVAERFLHHPLRRIREWARVESRAARKDAERQRQEEEEEKALR